MMHVGLLDILRCPFCGTAVSIVENDALAREGAHIDRGCSGASAAPFPSLPVSPS